jgi:hypothetical protein
MKKFSSVQSYGYVNIILIIVILILVIYCYLNRNNEGYSPYDNIACHKNLKGEWCPEKLNLDDPNKPTKFNNNQQIKQLMDNINNKSSQMSNENNCIKNAAENMQELCNDPDNLNCNLVEFLKQITEC